MKLVPQHEQQSPPAEWHGGVAEHAFEVRGVSQGVQTEHSPPQRQQLSPTTQAIGLWLVLWSLLLLPLLVGLVPVADDLGAYHLPLRSFYHSSLHAGEDWTWCPWIFGGYHLHGEGQIGGDHPLHQLLYRALPLPIAYGLECWWAYPATFFGMWWWLRQLRFTSVASQTAALAFSFCGYMSLRVVHTNGVQVIAHLPWLLGCLTWLEHRARRSTSWRSLLPPIAVSALLTGSQLLLGYPQYVVFTLIAEGLWLATLFVRLRQRECAPVSPLSMTGGNNRRNKQPAKALAIAWLIAKGLGLLLGAAQVLPTLEYLSLSERATWTTEQMFEGSWPALNLTQLLAPYLFKTRVVGQNTHELTIFVGLTTVVFAILGLAHSPRKSLRAVKAFAIMLCVTGLLLALGEASPLAAVTPYFPVWNRFRFPCRATLLLCLGIVLLAALGMQQVVTHARKSSQKFNPGNFSATAWKLFWVLLAGNLLLPIYAANQWPEFVADSLWRWGTPLIISCVFIAAWKFPFPSKALGLFTLLLGIELVYYAASFSHWQQWEFSIWRSWSTVEPNEDQISYTQPRFVPLNAVRSNSNIDIDVINCRKDNRYHRPPEAQIEGYAGVRPQRRLSYDLKHPGALCAAGVTHGRKPWNYKSSGSEEEICLNPINRAELVGEARLSNDPAHDLEQIDVLLTALVEKDQQLAVPSMKDVLKLQLTADRPGRLDFDLETNRDALLVTTESFHPGWHARVDGAEVPVLRVNGDFLGVRIPAAAQRVECYFSDNCHAVGRWVSGGSLVLLGLVFCWSRMRQNALGFAR